MNRLDKIWWTLMRLGTYSGCHQRPDRSFSIGLYQFPICARCTGVLIGQLTGLVLACKKVRLPTLGSLCLMLTLFLDWFLQYYKGRESTNTRRVLTGFLGGLGYIQILLGFGIAVVQGCVRLFSRK